MTPLPPELSQYRRIKDTEAAAILGVAVSTLRNARVTGRGAFASIPYSRMGSAIRYSLADILAFAESCKAVGR